MANPTGKGGFQKGQSGNPKGRAPKTKEEKLRKVLVSTVTLKDFREIVKKASDLAKRGDAPARKWLSDYLLGPPQQNLDVTSAGEPINHVSIIEVIRSAKDE